MTVQIPRSLLSPIRKAVALYSEGAMGNLAFLTETYTVLCKIFLEKAKNSLEHLEEELLNQMVVSTDATVVTVNGNQNYIRNFSVENTVIYRGMKETTIIHMMY